MIRAALLFCWALSCAGASPETYSFWIQPCTEDIPMRSGCRAGDPELAHWALEAWRQAAGSGLRLVPAAGEYEARIRIYWLGGRAQLYGDAREVFVNGQRGAFIEVHPDLAQFGARIAAAGENDPLFRDTVVYLTCLHETGHALGLPHTAEFADIMYNFQYGGDVLEYFSRYRRTIQGRSGFRDHAGLSAADRRKVASLYALQ